MIWDSKIIVINFISQTTILFLYDIDRLIALKTIFFLVGDVASFGLTIQFRISFLKSIDWGLFNSSLGN